jgi:AraC-like DNA-binding protein
VTPAGVATLLVLSGDATPTGTRIQRTVTRLRPVHTALGWRAVPGIVERVTVRVAVIDASTLPQLPFAELDWLRRQHPGIALVIVVDGRGKDLELFRLGRHGVDGLVLIELDELEANLTGVVERARARAEARLVARRLAGLVPPLALEGLAWAIEHAGMGARPAELAQGLGHPLERYRRELRRAGLPAPARLLLWGRLFRAGHLLERDGPSVADVARRLGYAGPLPLARALRREVGLPPSKIRARGGPACVMEAFLRARSRVAS